MICRLVTIVIVHTSLSSDFLTRYMLIASCVAIASIQRCVKPYAVNYLNVFDGLALQMMILIAVLPVFENLDSKLVVAILLTLVILPLLLLIGMVLLINKNWIKGLAICCSSRSTNGDNNQLRASVPLTDIDIIVDDSLRKKATICDMQV